jgi:HD-GYP domain-containing protein (c-di-GMP phosphodiesterase class II)
MNAAPPPALDAGSTTSLNARMAWLHERIRQHHPQVHRIAIALYDARHGLIKTYVSSGDADDALTHCQQPLDTVPSLAALALAHDTRVIHDFTQLAPPLGKRTAWLLSRGYRSSYTVPLHLSGELLGFLFFDSRKPGAFDARLPDDLQIHVQLCRLSLQNIIRLSRAFADMAPGAGADGDRHGDRVAGYARIIARAVAPHFACSDEFIEHVYLFAPMHDLGHCGAPRAVSHEPGLIDDFERHRIREQVAHGLQLIDDVMEGAGGALASCARVLRNIVGDHHEFLDGSGCPRGLRGAEVPLEARIVAVADIFDALSSGGAGTPRERNEDALARLRRLCDAGKLDPLCVAGLAADPDAVLEIQRRFSPVG